MIFFCLGFYGAVPNRSKTQYPFVIKQFRIISLFGEKRFVNSVKIFPASMKSINPIKKYPHIIESYACILKIFGFMFLLLINVLISFGICYALKELK